MMSFLISFLTKLVKTITLKRVLLWSFTGIFSVLTFTAFEHRREIYQVTALGNPRVGHIGATFTVGSQSRDELTKIVNENDNILAVSVLSADMRLNVRSVVFVYTQEKQILAISHSSASRLPLFTTDAMNNNQVVRSMNGDFSCGPFAGSITSSIQQFADSKAVSVCQSGLPPYYGFFTGFIAVLLSNPPSLEEQQRLKTLMDLISTEIYLRDIIPAGNWNFSP